MNPESTKRGRGRPDKFPQDKGRVQQTFRAKKRIDELIRSSAERNCRSISEELEYRLDSTFDGIVVGEHHKKLTENIRAAAEVNMRSPSMEVEVRLENYQLVENLFKRSDLFTLVMSITMDIIEHEKSTGRTWKEETLRVDTDISDTVSEIVRLRVIQEVERHKRLEHWRKIEEAKKEQKEQNELDEQMMSFRP